MRPVRWWRAAAPVLVGVVLLALWDATVRIEHIPPYILPGPMLIAKTLMADGPSLMGSLVVDVADHPGGARRGGRPRRRDRAVVLAVALARAEPLSVRGHSAGDAGRRDRALDIIIWVRQPFLVLLVCAWIVAFFPIVSNTTVGLNSADRTLLALFRLYGASQVQFVRYPKFPTALPYFLAGLRISGGRPAARTLLPPGPLAGGGGEIRVPQSPR